MKIPQVFTLILGDRYFGDRINMSGVYLLLLRKK